MLACVLAALAAPAATVRAEPADPPLPGPHWRAFQTGMFREDRLQHASLALTLGAGAGLASRSPGVAIVAAAALGFGKECVDAGTDRFDWGDLAADLAGAGVAGLVTHSLFR